jgi:hypothetical protein
MLPYCDNALQRFVRVHATGPRETLAVGVADLDGDGFSDPLYTNQLDESITVWWGGPERALGPRQDIGVGRSAESPVVHDVDGDGNRDIIASLSDASAFAYVRGLGGRTFAAAINVLQGAGPTAARVFQAMDGPQLVFFAGLDIAARRIGNGLPWPRQHNIAGRQAPDTSIFLHHDSELWVVTTNSGARFSTITQIDSRLKTRAREVTTEWPAVSRLFAANLTPPSDEELYGVTLAGQVVRMPLETGEHACAMTNEGAAYGAIQLANLDGDNIPDLIQANTCRECTSSHMIWWGGR